MIASNVWNKLVSTLQGNQALSVYVKYVYEGRRFDVMIENFPCIMLEPKQNFEIEKDLNQVKDVFLSIDIYAFSTPSDNDFKKPIVGDNNYKGVLDIENDIRACLQSSYSLGGTVMDIRPDATIFDQVDFGGKYPIRGMLIPIKILYRQNNGV